MNLKAHDAIPTRVAHTSSSSRRRPGPSDFGAMQKQPCVYILANRRNGTLYVGVTSDIVKRVHRHKVGAFPGFTKTHRIDTLVWFEPHHTMESAILREKALKEWKRAWKLRLIEDQNPYWSDRFYELL